MVIVVIVRVLNLAVPIVYKHLVDRLADVTSATHPRGAEAPETFTFIQARCGPVPGIKPGLWLSHLHTFCAQSCASTCDAHFL